MSEHGAEKVQHTAEKDVPGEGCYIVNVEGSPVHIQGTVDEWDDADHAAFADVVAAVRAMRGAKA